MGQEQRLFDLQAWLKTVNIHDEKWDFVMHNSHWLTSEWDDNCKQCQAKGKRPLQPIKALATSSPIASITTKLATLSTSMNSTASQTLKPVESYQTCNQNNESNNKNPDDLKTVSPEDTPTSPEPVLPFMTPIAPNLISNANLRPFVTPSTFNRNTYSRSTRQSTKKLLEQQNQQDLVVLNETFEMYTSALAETPDVVSECGGGGTNNRTFDDIGRTTRTNGNSSSTGNNNLLISPLNTVTKTQPPPRITSNFELLSNLPPVTTNNGTNSSFNGLINHQNSPQEVEQQLAFNHHQHHQPLVTSRIPGPRTGIPRIPVRSARNNGY